MAGGTAARIERCDAIGEIWRAGSKRSLRNDRRLRQPPEDAGAGSAGQDQDKENSSQHSTSIIKRHNSTTSMNALCAISFHEISGRCRRFGNKSRKSLF
jgi:hypothetical protein